MKYFKRLNVYKSGKGTGTNIYYPEKEEAYSYGWFCYARHIKGIGWVITANNYSNTTAKHINKFLRLKGYPKVKYINAPKGLKDKESIIVNYEYQISQLLSEINKPSTRKDKNIQRAAKIQSMRNDIKFVKKYL